VKAAADIIQQGCGSKLVAILIAWSAVLFEPSAGLSNCNSTALLLQLQCPRPLQRASHFSSLITVHVCDKALSLSICQ
jgi:hypothetical protein